MADEVAKVGVAAGEVPTSTKKHAYVNLSAEAIADAASDPGPLNLSELQMYSAVEPVKPGAPMPMSS